MLDAHSSAFAGNPCASWQLAGQAKPALIGADGVSDWAGFAQSVARTANGLIAAGLAPGDRVGIVMANSGATVEAMFGTLAAGAVAVPINLSVSDEAMCSMLNDAGVRPCS